MNSSLSDRLIVAFDRLAVAFQNSGSWSFLIDQAEKHEKLIHEVAVLTNSTYGEVKLFYETHDYDLEFIKFAVAICGTLNEKDMQQGIIQAYSPSQIRSFMPQINWEEDSTEKLSRVPYYLAYYISYPFIWFLYHLWRGFDDAKDNIWL